VLHDAATDAQAQRRARRIELPRLTLAGVQTLLKAMVAAQRTSEPQALAQHLHKRTGGNPLFVIELAQQALERGEATDASSLQALLGSSLKRSSTAAQQLAAVAAVAAEDFTVELAVTVMDQPALALMPAWGELQQRGLFAGHGLAHDLVRDAALAELPQAILHLRHWRAAGDVDRALPHAVHQLYAVNATGLSSMPQELEILELLEQASDPVLMANLWLTAEFDADLGGGSAPADTGQRLRALRQRVERAPARAAHAAWIAYETARERRAMDLSNKAAYDVLAPAAQRMPPRGIERAFVEKALVYLAHSLTGDARTHLRRARHALAELPHQPCVNRVRMELEDVEGMFLDHAQGLRTLAARSRAGRRRGDLAAVARDRMRMGYVQAVLGNASHALRHYSHAACLQAGDVNDTERFQTPFLVGKFALNAGRYALAEQLLTAGEEPSAKETRPVYLALLYLRLGNMAAVRAQLDRVGPDALVFFPAQTIHAHARAEVDRFEGSDPVPALQQQLDMAVELGLGGLNRDLMAWEIVLRTAGRAASARCQRRQTTGQGAARNRRGVRRGERSTVAAVDSRGCPTAQARVRQPNPVSARGPAALCPADKAARSA
jgi:hypothetical protein